jgi:hypothetical protein
VRYTASLCISAAVTQPRGSRDTAKGQGQGALTPPPPKKKKTKQRPRQLLVDAIARLVLYRLGVGARCTSLSAPGFQFHIYFSSSARLEPRARVPSCKSPPLEGLLVAPPIKRQSPHLLFEIKTYKWLVRRGGARRKKSLSPPAWGFFSPAAPFPLAPLPLPFWPGFPCFSRTDHLRPLIYGI